MYPESAKAGACHHVCVCEGGRVVPMVGPVRGRGSSSSSTIVLVMVSYIAVAQSTRGYSTSGIGACAQTMTSGCAEHVQRTESGLRGAVSFVLRMCSQDDVTWVAWWIELAV